MESQNNQPQAPSQPSPPLEASSQAEMPASTQEYDTSGVQDDVSRAIEEAKRAFPESDEGDEGNDGGENGEGEKSTGADLTSAPEKETSQKQKPAPAQDTDKVKPSQWARFHREQKEFFAQKQAHKAELAEMQRIKGILDNAKSDRLAALEAMGYSDIKDFVTGLAEDGGRLTPERRELNELKAWRQAQEKQVQEAQERQEQEQLRASEAAKLDALRTNIKNRITSEQYSSRLINLKDADEQVLVEMDKMAEETGQMPEIDDAIERVEGRFQGYLEEMMHNPAIASFFREKLQERQSSPKAGSQSKYRERSRTIDGDTPTGGLGGYKRPDRALTPDEEVEDVIRHLKAINR